MCVETISIALCAVEPSTVSYTCGKLHMVAGARAVCNDAINSCVCFFGTCGSIERDFGTTTVDLKELNKIRCAPCSAQQDDLVGRHRGQDILESPLLNRTPTSINDENAQYKHLAKLKELWGNHSTCPYHSSPEGIKTLADSTPKIQAAPQHDPWTEPALKAGGKGASIEIDHEIIKEEVVTVKEEVIGDDIGDEHHEVHSTTLEQATEIIVQESAPNPDEQIDEEHDENTDNGAISTGLETSVWAPGNSPEKNTVPAPRRNVPVPTRNITPQVREAAKQLSGLRAFLNAQA